MGEDILRHLTGLADLQGYETVNDSGMMRNLVLYLKEYENRDKPFFIALSTRDTHMNIADDSDEKISENFRKLDNAFGIFWNYFKNSQYYNNTIIILTADHASPPFVPFIKYVREKDRKKVSFFDEIACIIFDKRYKFPKRFKVRASSIDLTPSILQLLEINNIDNSFQGLSIFSDRKKFPFFLYTSMSRFYINDNTGIHEHWDKDIRENILDDYNHLEGNINEDEYKRELGMKLWYAYNKQLNGKNRIWNNMFERKEIKADQ
jgi:arylsulfatase A-like enzyme